MATSTLPSRYDVFRFPFLANEIFNCEINALLDRFFDAPEKLKKARSEEATPAVVEDKKEKEDGDTSSEEEAGEKEVSPASSTE